MLYKQFFDWLIEKLLRDEYCVHDFKEVGVTFSPFKEFWGITETGFRHIYKCNKCQKKEKRLPRESYTGAWIYN